MDDMIATTAVVYSGVHLGGGCVVGEFALLGVPSRNHQPGDLETHIGPDAMIRSHTAIYAGNFISARLQTGHGVMIRELNEIGDDVVIECLRARVGRNVSIGVRTDENFRRQSGVRIKVDGLILGDAA